MNPVVVGVIGIVIVLGLMALEVPIGFAMAFVGILGFTYLVNFQGAFFQAAAVPFTLITDYNFSVLPLFMFMAHIVFQSGLSMNLYDCANKWMGRLPGGLAIATIGACAVFAAISASSIATAVTIGLVAIPEMKKHGYHHGFACGTVAVGGTLGPLIPPSGILIIYGILTQQSIGKLFIAGIVPGIILSLMFMALIYFRARINPALAPPGPRVSFKEKIVSLGRAVEILVLVAFTLGGLIVGWFTPTEAGAVGAGGAVFITLVRRRLDWKKFKQAAVDTIEGTGMIFVILIGALVLNAFMSVSKVPMALAGMMTGLSLPKEAILGIMVLIYLALGCLVDAMAMILLTIPIFYPVAVAAGVDPIFFGILIVLVVEMAVITPPVGMNVYAISGIDKETPMIEIFKGGIPYVFVILLFIIMVIFFPRIVTFLPQYVG
jgi:C4-dicarboxylate transporter, DctM subunit